jgi:carbon storage regulator
MLILTRKPGQSLYIGDDIKVTIVEIKGHQIRVGIDAPKSYRIYREEIYLQILEENKSAAEAAGGTGINELDGLSEVFKGRVASSSVEPKRKGLGRVGSAVAAPKSQGSVEVVVKRKRGKKADE